MLTNRDGYPTQKAVGALVALIVVVLGIGTMGWEAIDDRDACFKMRYGEVVERDIDSGLTSEWWIYNYECLPMTDIQIPEGESNNASDDWLRVPFETSDRVPLRVAVRAVVAFDPATVEETFMSKKTLRAILAEVQSGIVNAVAVAGNTMPMDSIFGGGLNELQERFKASMTDMVGDLVDVQTVFVQMPTMPENLRAARTQAREREEEVERERQQLQIDSLQAASTRVRSSAYADSVQTTMAAEAAAFAQSSELSALREAEAFAGALANLLSNCTSNCVVGATVLDQFLAGMSGGNR